VFTKENANKFEEAGADVKVGLLQRIINTHLLAISLFQVLIWLAIHLDFDG
jgi:hypothetical protein